MEERSNMEYIGQGFYVVRTQAGFRKAIRHFNEGDSDTSEVDGWPTSYPSLVSLSRGYNGTIFTGVNCVHLNVLSDVVKNHA